MDAQPVFAYNWLAPPYLENPYPLYEQARREVPVFYSPIFNLWVLTRYQDVRAALMDPQRFSSAFFFRTPNNPPPEVQAVLDEGFPEVHMLANQDPPGHTRTRSIVSKALTPQRIQMVRPRIQTITDQLVDRFVNEGSTDIVTQLTYLLPMEIMALLIGLPTQDLDHIKRWTEDLMMLVSPEVSLERQVEAAHGSIAFQRYLEGEIEERECTPRDDLLTAMVQARVEGERPLDWPELISLVIVLIFAGHETTTNLIGNTLLQVLKHPEILRAVRANPGLAANVVEETLRFDAPVQGMFRTTTEPVTVGGAQIPAGASVFLSFGAANRDPEVFPEPDRFDPYRPNKDLHLGFGRGIHHCMGVLLARTEAQVVLNTLVQRLPNMQLDSSYGLTYLPSLLHRGPRQLRLTWGRDTAVAL